MIGLGIDQLIGKSPPFIRVGVQNIQHDITVIAFEFIQCRFEGMTLIVAAQRHIVGAIGAE